MTYLFYLYLFFVIGYAYSGAKITIFFPKNPICWYFFTFFIPLYPIFLHSLRRNNSCSYNKCLIVWDFLDFLVSKTKLINFLSPQEKMKITFYRSEEHTS